MDSNSVSTTFGVALTKSTVLWEPQLPLVKYGIRVLSCGMMNIKWENK